MAESIFTRGLNNDFLHINSNTISNKSSDNVIDTYFFNNQSSVLTKKQVKRAIAVRPNQLDPLSLIDLMLSMYIRNQAKKAEVLASEISIISKAVADINRLWGTLMTKNLGNVDPTKIDKRTDIQQVSYDIYNEIDGIIKNTLDDPRGITAITDKHFHNYDELQSANATMTAYSDTIKVDIDSIEQEFKNLMTAITSAQEEIRDLRRNIISFAER